MIPRRAALFLFVAACGGDPRPAKEYGAELFRDKNLAESRFNAFSCDTCHATTAEPRSGRIDAGFTMYDVTARPSWWGGKEAHLLDAVNTCFIDFMRGTSKLTEDEDRSKALYEYLASLSPSETSPALELHIVKDIADVPRGDMARGEAVYNQGCRVCHGALHTGDGQLTGEAVLIPQVFDEYPGLFPDASAAEVVLEKIRHGKYFGVSGTMPPFSLEVLSDEDAGALLTYLGI